MLVIIDYGMGNLRSVEKSLKRIGIESKISSNENDIEAADKLILPGVGHFKNGMNNIIRLGLDKTLNKKVIQDKIPILGICLGMQLFTKFSEEGEVEGLGWIEAKTVRFNFNGIQEKYKIPHIGWNSLIISKKATVYDGITSDDSFYFVHSYYVHCSDTQDILSKTLYGNEFVSSFQKNNITGMQFHPEKSYAAGLKIFTNFCKTS